MQSSKQSTIQLKWIHSLTQTVTILCLILLAGCGEDGTSTLTQGRYPQCGETFLDSYHGLLEASVKVSQNQKISESAETNALKKMSEDCQVFKESLGTGSCHCSDCPNPDPRFKTQGALLSYNDFSEACNAAANR